MTTRQSAIGSADMTRSTAFGPPVDAPITTVSGPSISVVAGGVEVVDTLEIVAFWSLSAASRSRRSRVAASRSASATDRTASTSRSDSRGPRSTPRRRASRRSRPRRVRAPQTSPRRPRQCAPRASARASASRPSAVPRLRARPSPASRRPSSQHPDASRRPPTAPRRRRPPRRRPRPRVGQEIGDQPSHERRVVDDNYPQGVVATASPIRRPTHVRKRAQNQHKSTDPVITPDNSGDTVIGIFAAEVLMAAIETDAEPTKVLEFGLGDGTYCLDIGVIDGSSTPANSRAFPTPRPRRGCDGPARTHDDDRRPEDALRDR